MMKKVAIVTSERISDRSYLRLEFNANLVDWPKLTPFSQLLLDVVREGVCDGSKKVRQLSVDVHLNDNSILIVTYELAGIEPAMIGDALHYTFCNLRHVLSNCWGYQFRWHEAVKAGRYHVKQKESELKDQLLKKLQMEPCPEKGTINWETLSYDEFYAYARQVLSFDNCYATMFAGKVIDFDEATLTEFLRRDLYDYKSIVTVAPTLHLCRQKEPLVIESNMTDTFQMIHLRYFMLPFLPDIYLAAKVYLAMLKQAALRKWSQLDIEYLRGGNLCLTLSFHGPRDLAKVVLPTMTQTDKLLADDWRESSLEDAIQQVLDEMKQQGSGISGVSDNNVVGYILRDHRWALDSTEGGFDLSELPNYGDRLRRLRYGLMSDMAKVLTSNDDDMLSVATGYKGKPFD
ncbi:MAG: hypothetical protein Q4C83_02860 [Candidatus Saccharibacteria bacterium]|nr:hypothetical protein [Candidatus Saccharibacteria bacterium]